MINQYEECAKLLLYNLQIKTQFLDSKVAHKKWKNEEIHLTGNLFLPRRKDKNFI